MMKTYRSYWLLCALSVFKLVGCENAADWPEDKDFFGVFEAVSTKCDEGRIVYAVSRDWTRQLERGNLQRLRVNAFESLNEGLVCKGELPIDTYGEFKYQIIHNGSQWIFEATGEKFGKISCHATTTAVKSLWVEGRLFMHLPFEPIVNWPIMKSELGPFQGTYLKIDIDEAGHSVNQSDFPLKEKRAISSSDRCSFSSKPAR